MDAALANRLKIKWSDSGRCIILAQEKACLRYCFSFNKPDVYFTNFYALGKAKKILILLT